MHINGLSVILFIASLVNLYIGVYTWNRRNVPGRKYFGLLMFASAWWSLAIGCEHQAVDAATKIIFTKISYPGLVATPILYFLFTLAYSKLITRFSKISLTAIWFVPFLVLILAITNEHHYLQWSEYRPVQSVIGLVILYKSGIGVWALTVYSYFHMILATVILIRYIPKNQKLYRHQVTLILLSLIYPWLSNIIYLSRITPYPELDFTPIAFSLTGITLFFAIIKVGLFQIVPQAKESLFESMVDAVLVIDKKMIIIDFNPTADKVFKLNDLIGRGIVELFPDLSDKLSHQTESYPIRFEYHHIENQEGNWYDVVFSPFYDSGNSHKSGYLLVFRDINKRKKFEEKLLISEQQLKEINATKDKFFSIIAHDLKNPLGSMISTTELLTNPEYQFDDKEYEEIFDSLHLSAKNLYNLLDNLLTWSRSQRGKIAFDPDYHNLSEMVNINIALLKGSAEAKGIQIFSSLPQELSAFFDYNMINATIRNLMSNAIKFTKPNGSVTISSESLLNDDDSVPKNILISIKDNGVGISEEDIHKLFRIDISHTTIGTGEEKGTGLGLVLCKEFVEKNGGQIFVESKLNFGSTFSFTLPLKQID